MKPFEALDRSRAEFDSRLCQVQVSHWESPTPCERWDVRDLVNHVVGGAYRYTILLHGGTAEDQVRAAGGVDYLGQEPVRAFRLRADEMSAAFHEPGALDRTVHHVVGDMSGARLLGLRIAEFALHAWDLARAIGAAEELDPGLVEYLYMQMPEGGFAAMYPNFYAPPVGQSAEDAEMKDRLLRGAGRVP